MSHELAGMERRWVIQRLHSVRRIWHWRPFSWAICINQYYPRISYNLSHKFLSFCSYSIKAYNVYKIMQPSNLIYYIYLQLSYPKNLPYLSQFSCPTLNLYYMLYLYQILLGQKALIPQNKFFHFDYINRHVYADNL